MLEAIINAITSGITNLYNTIKSFNDSIGQWFIDLTSNIGEWFSDIGTWFGELGSNIGGWFGELGSNLGNWLSYLNPFNENFFGNRLIELLSEALSFLFTPSQDNVTGLQTTINEKFGFVDSIKIAIEDIKDMLENIENGTSEFKLDIDSDVYSGEVVLFDLSWYSPFKSYGDLVFTGFAYVFFVIRLWRAIPGVLNGASSIVDITGRGGFD